MILYQFPISHYCEKARWALDHKKIPYTLKNLIPGPHIWTTRRIALQTSVPILEHDKTVIQGSGAIISYLDQLYPETSLTPSDPALKKEALELEKYFDTEIGMHLRRYIYNTILPRREIVEPMLLAQGPKWGPAVYSVIFPLVRFLMKKSMNINPESAARSETRLTGALEKLDGMVRKSSFLVGEKLSRADITAASLLAPLCWPPNHSFPWPREVPEPLAAFRREWEPHPSFQWVLKIYREHRKSSPL